MKKHSILFVLALLPCLVFSQKSLSELLKKYNTNSVPYITVQELAMPKTKATVLDAREMHEFKVSHIKNAIHIGYDNFDIKTIEAKIPNKKQPIAIYCSVGIRSEDIAEKLKQNGYTNVYNLYGGIFEWKNNNFTVVDSLNQSTNNVHTFNKDWSKWLKKGNKVYE